MVAKTTLHCATQRFLHGWKIPTPDRLRALPFPWTSSPADRERRLFPTGLLNKGIAGLH